MIDAIKSIVRRRRSTLQLSSEAGFSMITASMAVVVGMLLSVSAYDAVNADLSQQQTSKWHKVAYATAQSGATDYIGHMAQDQNYFTYCDNPTLLGSSVATGLGHNAINDTDTGNTATHPTRRWLPYGAVDSAVDNEMTSQYTIDLIPANGATSCKQGTDPTAAMVDQTSGTIRVRVTARAGNPVPRVGTSMMPNPNGTQTTVTRTAENIDLWRQKRWKSRSVVLEFRQNGFLDYAYFTDRESQDPGLYTLNGTTQTACSAYFQPTQGLTGAADGRRNKLSNSAVDCGISELQFAGSDAINGPFHTNDSIMLAGWGTAGPRFGRAGKADVVEIYDQGIEKFSAAASGTVSSCPYRLDNTSNELSNSPYMDASGGYICPTASNTLDVNGPVRLGDEAPLLQLPEDNADLANWGLASNGGLTLTGSAKIILKGNLMDIYQPANATTPTTANATYPSSGVIYVKTPGGAANCDSQPKDLGSAAPFNWYPFMGSQCGYVEVSGTYSKSLTIASDADVIITSAAGAFTPPAPATGTRRGILRSSSATSAVLGIVAKKYVRIRNYTNDSPESLSPVTWVDAAILALKHSFTVDRFNQGSALGTLRVNGAIAQAFRGPVGTGNGGTGYIKDYQYDGRLKYLTPPHFLTPEQSNWKVSRSREQVPACSCKLTGP